VTRALFVALLCAACHKGAAPAAPPECAQREDCLGGLAGGLLCIDQKCAGCTKSAQCRISELCDPVRRACTLRACWGDECTAHSDCNLGAFCVQGLCLNPDHPRTVGSSSCAVQVCGTSRDCNVGQRCNQRTFVCEQDLGCLAGAPCASGQVCNPGSGACEAACTADTASQVCGPLIPCSGGRCVQCATDAACGPGLTCDVAAGVCRGPSGCSTSRDCEVPKTCDRATGTCALPRGPCSSNESCALDERCETRTGKCVAGACLPDRLDPAGDAAHAAPVAPGSYPLLTLCGTEEDWFSIDLLSGDTVQAVADADPLGSFDLQLLSADQTVIDDEPFAVLRTVGATGRYFVRARTNDASALYGLRVQVAHGAACAHNPPAPHPDAVEALPLGPGPTYDLAVCPTEQTWFSFRPPAGQGVDLTASLSPTAGGALVFTLFDSDGATALSEDAAGTAAPHVAFAHASGELFFLRVMGADPAVQNRYDLTARYTLP
jgi:hypothetical protein